MEPAVQTGIYDRIALKAPHLATPDRGNWRSPTGERAKDVQELQFDRRLTLEFHGAGITEDTIDAIMVKNPQRLLVGE